MVGVWLVLFIGGGERAVFDIGVVGLDGFGYSLADIGVVTDEFGSEDVGHAEHILRDEHLTVYLRTCTDADDRDGERGSHLRCQLMRDLLENQGEATSILEGLGVAEQLLGLLLLLGAETIATESIDALRGKTEMSHDGDASLSDMADGFGYTDTALDFDGIGERLFHDTHGIVYGLRHA